MGRGDHTTISEAIRAASPGDRILVRPGLYQEGLVLNKPLKIIGDGALAEIVVQATGADTLSFQTTMGRVAHLTLRQMGGGGWYCVDISQGRLIILEDCDITSQSLACVAIRGGADPRLLLNRIHDGKRGGIDVYDNGQGTLEDNHIYGNALAGVAIRAGGNPTLRRNHIYDGQQEGIYVDDNGQGTLEDNHIYGNALAGVAIRGRSSPTLRRNRINRNNDWAIWVSDRGGGTIEDNACGTTPEAHGTFPPIASRSSSTPVTRSKLTRRANNVWSLTRSEECEVLGYTFEVAAACCLKSTIMTQALSSSAACRRGECTP